MVPKVVCMAERPFKSCTHWIDACSLAPHRGARVEITDDGWCEV